MKKAATLADPRGEKLCNLHTHSVYSDGSLRPAQIIAQAKELELAVALTDHNTVAGLPEFTAEATRKGVTAVGGIEITAIHQDVEFHLVGLFVAPEYYGKISRVMEKYCTLRQISNQALVERLNSAGYALDYAAIKSKSPKGNINRVHVALALQEGGYVRSVREAFDTLLAPERGFYVPPERLELTEAIRLLRRCRAIPVLAHPLQDVDEAPLRRILPELIGAGLLAMEVYHPSYDRQTVLTARRIAQAFSLLSSGGSDFHGTAKPEVCLGSGKGNVAVPMAVYFALREKAEQLRREPGADDTPE